VPGLPWWSQRSMCLTFSERATELAWVAAASRVWQLLIREVLSTEAKKQDGSGRWELWACSVFGILWEPMLAVQSGCEAISGAWTNDDCGKSILCTLDSCNIVLRRATENGIHNSLKCNPASEDAMLWAVSSVKTGQICRMARIWKKGRLGRRGYGKKKT